MSTIKETTLHPDGNDGVDLYPKTNINQVQELPQKLTSVESQINQLNIDKLTKPTNPTADSAVTMLADGTVGTKPLSEIGSGGKLYEHNINVNITDEQYNKTIEITLYNNDGSEINVAEDIPRDSVARLNAQPVSSSNMPYFSLVIFEYHTRGPSPDNPTPKAIITVYGVGTDVAGTTAKPIFENYSEYTMVDRVVQL